MPIQDAWLVVGLGNPGPTYASTRHNIGAMIIDDLAVQHSVKLGRHKRAIAEVAQIKIEQHSVVLVKPMSFMNTSGGPVKALAQFYKIDTDHIIVLHDELDIARGTVRCKFGGGDNGHNGLKSIRASLNTGDWYRVRLGIGRPPGQQDPADFVLKSFSSSEATDVHQLRSVGADAVTTIIKEGLDVAQSRFNS